MHHSAVIEQLTQVLMSCFQQKVDLAQVYRDTERKVVEAEELCREIKQKFSSLQDSLF
jgi:hypothetical protein